MPTITGTQFYGVVAVSGSLTLSGSITSTELVASASFATTATTASYSINAASATNATNATNAVTASYAASLPTATSISGNVYKPIAQQTITASFTADSMPSGQFYIIDAAANVVVTFRPGTDGVEYTFFAKSIASGRSYSFAEDAGARIYSKNGHLKMNGSGSIVTAKYFNDGNSVALYGDLMA